RIVVCRGILLVDVTATRLLAIQLRTLFILTGAGKIERENDPDHSPGPRLWLAGCAARNVAAIRCDVTDAVAAEIAALAATEPPFASPERTPRYLDRYVDLLSRDAPVSRQTFGSIYKLPHHLRHEGRVELIDDESDEGRRLHEFLSTHGMPDGLAELGFRNV